MKVLRALLLAVLCAGACFSSAFAQLTIDRFETGTYTPGSNIAVTFTIDPATCIEQGNIFHLRLSDASGNFAPGTIIGSYNSFYSTFVNGTIPNGTPAGTYKVRVESTNPTQISNESSPFQIQTLPTVTVNPGYNKPFSPTNTQAMGFCSPQTGTAAEITINKGTSSGDVALTFENELDQTTSFKTVGNTQIKFTPDQAHYTLFAKVEMPNGTIGTRAYFIINNKTITSLNTSGSNVVCLAGNNGTLSYPIDVTSLRQNFPGSTYQVSWGDESTSTYTICDLTSGSISHTYHETSCGQTNTSGGVTTYNSYGVNLQLVSPFCGNVGTPISTTARVLSITQNRIAAPLVGCTNADITFNNASILGDNPNNNGPSCVPDNATFNWYVDGQFITSGDITVSLVHRFTTNGRHTVELESISNTGCPGPRAVHEICIQNPPQPSFTLPAQTVCGGSNGVVIKLTNTSIVDNNCDPGGTTYNWNITPAPVYVTGNSTSFEPEVRLTSGPYTISLTIRTQTCGDRTSAEQEIDVDLDPQAKLSPDVTLCTKGTYSFDPFTTGPTKTFVGGTAVPKSINTYKWVVTGGPHSFSPTKNENTDYPEITFNDYATYTISVTHTNSCGSVTSTQHITFTQAPDVNAGPDQNICYNQATVALNGTITGTYQTKTWIGAGTFSDPNDLNAIYTPTAGERAAGRANIVLRVTTSLPAPCNSIDNEVVINIKPQVLITSPANISRCSGEAVNYPPASTNGTTYTWTANASPNISGSLDGAGQQIPDILTNSDPVNPGTVTYTITPTYDGCTGDPFMLTVTVNPRPVLTATPPADPICSGQPAGITLSSNITGTTYTWTSTVNGTITGNTSSSGSTINDQLVNNGTSVGTVDYTIIPFYNGCSGTPVTVTVNVQPSPTAADAGQSKSICNVTAYILEGNDPDPGRGTGTWSQVSGPTTAKFANINQYNTTVSDLQIGGTYVFRWTITVGNNCSSTPAEVTITINEPSIGGTPTAIGNSSVCAGSNGQITLSGQRGMVVRWESSTTNAAPWTTINSTSTTINYTNLTTTTYFRAIVQNGSCPPIESASAMITVNQPAVSANAGADQQLCAQTLTMLNANNPSPNTGLWTIVSGPNTAQITDPTQYNSTFTNLTPGVTYVLRWTITGPASCGPVPPDDVVIVNLAPIQNNSVTAAAETCSGQTVTIAGSTPTGGTGTYSYVWESSTTGNAPWTTMAQTGRDLTVTVNSTMYYRRTVNSGACSSISNVIQIIARPGIANNVLPNVTPICAGATPAQIVGSVPTGGDGTYTYSWEMNANGTWQPITGATGKDYAPPALTQTTSYRRIVASGPCSGNISNVTTITVYPLPVAEYTWTSDIVCANQPIDGTNIKAVAYPGNGTYDWYVGTTLIGSGINFPGYTITTYNTTVTIRLVVHSNNGCADAEFSHQFRTRENVLAAFDIDRTVGCEATDVTVTNNTVNDPSASYDWRINGVPYSTARDIGTITLQPTNDGIDKKYDITLRVTTACGQPTTQTKTVIISSSPIAVIAPLQNRGCSRFTAEFINTSPGKDTYSYQIDFGDGTPLTPHTWGQPIKHDYEVTETTTFKITMYATNICGTRPSQTVEIEVVPNTIVPVLYVPPSKLRICTGDEVVFTNFTAGANDFVYDFKDGTQPVHNVNGKQGETITHQFTQPGVYVVRMTASNGCATPKFDEKTITVVARPTVSINADVTSGCEGLAVKFTQTSTGADKYEWNFGDGSSPVFDPNPSHNFNVAPGTYTVTLTVTNTNGCTQSASMPITIIPPPLADFAVSPATTISIPDYTFRFTNASSADAETFEWDFGDKLGTSRQKDPPPYTYKDVGTYEVKLTARNRYGCEDTQTIKVNIIGVPGYTQVPNSFMPGGTNLALQTFRAIGTGMKSWKMTVFNKWGQVLWETTKLVDGQPVEGWDGTYKGVPQPQGIYFWKIDVEMINGTEWKGMSVGNAPPRRTGQIYLIR